MPGGNVDKAANRARQYRDRIAAKQADGDFRGALHEAERWLLSEASRVARQRPGDAQRIHVEVTERLATLAEALPSYRPRGK